MISTPPSTPAHDFLDYVQKAQAEGGYAELTLDENNEIPEETKKKLIEIRSKMAVFKMAKILTGDWFDDLKFDEKKKEYYYEKDKLI